MKHRRKSRGMETEKKVEYIELIYDLIFVYIIGRNNHLLHVMENGFIDPDSFLTYVLASLVVLQIWYYTTLFINRYGENDKRMHIAIFVNMYLLYFMARGIRVNWQEEFFSFNGAWLLILLNIALQYYLQLKKTEEVKHWERVQIRMVLLTILIQAGIIAVSFPIFSATGIPVSPLAVVFGIIAAAAGSRVNMLVPVDFPHLTERVMLYVVFTFGEMIIAITDYFEGSWNMSTVYYSLCAFLIVAGLFSSYGILYNSLIERNTVTSGTAYMMLHVFLILSLNHITAALEFMRKETVSDLPKNLFLIASFALYFVMMYLIMRFNKEKHHRNRKGSLLFFAGLGVFILIMMLCYKKPAVSIAVTVVYIWSVFVSLVRFSRHGSRHGHAKKQDVS